MKQSRVLVLFIGRWRVIRQFYFQSVNENFLFSGKLNEDETATLGSFCGGTWKIGRAKWALTQQFHCEMHGGTSWFVLKRFCQYIFSQPKIDYPHFSMPA